MKDSSHHITKDLVGRSIDTSVPVLLLKLGCYPLHHGTVGAIRSFGRLGVPVFGVHESENSPASKSRYLKGCAFGVLSVSDPAACLERIIQIGQRIGRQSLLIPTDDAGAILLAEQQDVLRPYFLFPEQQTSLARTVAAKDKLYRLCRNCGIPTPSTAIISNTDDLYRVLQSGKFPLVLKNAHPWLSPDGVRSTMLIYSVEAALDYWHKLNKKSQCKMIVQEYIPGEYSEDWIYNGYHNAGGMPVVGFTGRKLRSFPPYTGSLSFGMSIHNVELVEIVRHLTTALRYNGVIDLDFRFDKRDGKYKLVDFNPRVGAQFQLFRNDAAVDVVRAMHLDLTGRDVPSGMQVDGREFISEIFDPRSFLIYRKNKEVSFRRWLAEFWRSEERAWVAWDDLRPFVTVCRGAVEHRVRRVWQHLAKSVSIKFGFSKFELKRPGTPQEINVASRQAPSTVRAGVTAGSDCRNGEKK
jgi:D-aspartate ligase